MTCLDISAQYFLLDNHGKHKAIGRLDTAA